MSPFYIIKSLFDPVAVTFRKTLQQVLFCEGEPALAQTELSSPSCRLNYSDSSKKERDTLAYVTAGKLKN